MRKQRGFTLIELLVVIAIIGLLSTLAVVALNSARLKARDAKRVADIKQIQTGLELYFNDKTAYPGATIAGLGSAGAVSCLNSAGFTTANCPSPYMGLVPRDPNSAKNYAYTSAGATTYVITFELEGQTGGLIQGTRTANENGIQ